MSDSTILNGESDKFEQEIIELIRDKQKEVEDKKLLKLDKDIIRYCMTGETEICIMPVDYINPDKVKEIYEQRGYKWELSKDMQKLSWDKDSKLDAGEAYILTIKSIERMEREHNDRINDFVEQLKQALIWHARKYGITKICFENARDRIFINHRKTDFVFDNIYDILQKLKKYPECVDDIRTVLNKEDIDITVDEQIDEETSDDDHDSDDSEYNVIGGGIGGFLVRNTFITIFSSIDEKKRSMFGMTSDNPDQSQLTYGMKIVLEAEQAEKYLSRIREARDESVLFIYFYIKNCCEKVARKGKMNVKITLDIQDIPEFYHKLETLCVKRGFDTNMTHDLSHEFHVFWNNAKLGTDAYKFLELSSKVIREKKHCAVSETVILIQKLIKSHIKEDGDIPLTLNYANHSNIITNIKKYYCFNEIKESLPKCIEFTSVSEEYYGDRYTLNVKVDTNKK